MALGSVAQDRFDLGIVRSVEGQKIPENGVYDIVDGLLDDEGAVYRRGGSTYKSSPTVGVDISGLADVTTVAGQRTIFWSLASSDVYVLAANDTTPVTVDSSMSLVEGARVTGVAGYVVLRGDSTSINLYAGSRKTAAYTTGTLTVTNGSTSVTGVGTAWSANVDAGMILALVGASTDYIGTVQSVDSNTTITLREPWAGPTAAGATYSLQPTSNTGLPGGAYIPSAFALAGQRLIGTTGNRVYLSPRNDPHRISAAVTDYHELPGDAATIGAEGLGDAALIFTTAGVWMIGNLAYDLTDDLGNVQHTVEQLSKDIILWDDGGIVGWNGQTVVPALDNVYLLSASGRAGTIAAGPPVPIASAILPLYRSYVKAGYRTGVATVHRSHYFLPVLDSSGTWLDTLVCRLDGPQPAWVRWSGHAGNSRAFAQRVGSTTRQPKLFATGGANGRVVELTDTFSPSGTNKRDADVTTHVLTVITRDYAIRRSVNTLWRYLRARYELTDAASDNPTWTLEYQTGPTSGSWTLVTGSAPEDDGTMPYEWSPDKRAQAIRFRLKTASAAATAILRSIEVFYRDSGKR